MIGLLTGLQTKKPRQTSWLGLLDLATLSFVYSQRMWSVAKCRRSWVVGGGRGSWVWVVGVGVGKCRG